MAVGEMPSRRESPGTGEQKLDAVLYGRSREATAAPHQSRARGVPLSRRHHAGRPQLRCRPGAPTARRGGRAPPLSLPAPRALPHTARGPRAASRPRWPRRQRAGRAGGGSGTGGASVVRMRSTCRSSSTASIAAASDVRTAAAASSGSNGSPATAAPSSTRRPPSDSNASSSLSDAATAAGTSRPVGKARERRCVPPHGRATGRAARGRRGCHRTPRRGRWRQGVDPVAEKLASLIRRERAELDPSQRRRTCARSSAAARRSGVWRGRSATAMSTAAPGGRRNSAPSSSTEAGSAQWKSSSTSTSGLLCASCSSSARTARWLRYRSCWSATVRPAASADSDGKTCASSASTSPSRVESRLGSRLPTYSSNACTRPRTAARARVPTPTPKEPGVRAPRHGPPAPKGGVSCRFPARPPARVQLAGLARAPRAAARAHRARGRVQRAGPAGRARRAATPCVIRPPLAGTQRLHDRGACVIGGRTVRRQCFLRMSAARLWWAPPRAAKSGCRFRGMPRCRRGRFAARSNHVSLSASAPPQAARVRRRLCRSRTPEPASPQSDAGLVPLRRARDLVDGRRRH